MNDVHSGVERPIWRQPWCEHIRRSWRGALLASTTVGVIFLTLSRFIAIGPNRTGSLPNSIFLVVKNHKVPARGGFVAFYPGPNKYYPADSMFVKRLIGLPGDKVTYVGHRFYINGRPTIAVTKDRAHDGQIMHPGPTGTLPACRYFVVAPNPWSYDSRYSDIGWVKCSQIIGVAHGLPR